MSTAVHHGMVISSTLWPHPQLVNAHSGIPTSNHPDTDVHHVGPAVKLTDSSALTAHRVKSAHWKRLQTSLILQSRGQRLILLIFSENGKSPEALEITFFIFFVF